MRERERHKRENKCSLHIVQHISTVRWFEGILDGQHHVQLERASLVGRVLGAQDGRAQLARGLVAHPGRHVGRGMLHGRKVRGRVILLDYEYLESMSHLHHPLQFLLESLVPQHDDAEIGTGSH